VLLVLTACVCVGKQEHILLDSVVQPVAGDSGLPLSLTVSKAIIIIIIKIFVYRYRVVTSEVLRPGSV